MAIHKPHARETTLRHLWLAGLGLVSLLRPGTFASRAHPSALARQGQRRARGTADPLGSRAPAAAIARSRIVNAITLLEEGIGTRLAPLVRALALRPTATPAVERGGATEADGPGAPAGRAGRIRRRARVPRAVPTAGPGQSR